MLRLLQETRILYSWCIVNVKGYNCVWVLEAEAITFEVVYPLLIPFKTELKPTFQFPIRLFSGIVCRLWSLLAFFYNLPCRSVIRLAFCS